MTDTESDGAVVEQAKGVIMLRYGVSSGESLAAMSRWAQEADVTLPDVARALVMGICQGRVTPETRVTVRWLEQRLRADITDVSDITAVTQVTDEADVAGKTADAGSSVRRRRASTLAPRSSATAAITAARQWRYQSAVRAARALANM